MRKLSLLILSVSAWAQIPTDTLVTKKFSRPSLEAKFLADHPGAVLHHRDTGAAHFKNQDGTYTALFGEAVSEGLEVWQTSSGYRTANAPVVIRVVDGSGQSNWLELYSPSTGKAIKLNSNKLQYNGDDTFSFSWNSLTWTVTLTPRGFDLRSGPIQTSMGPKTVTLPYNQSFLTLQQDAATGDLVGDENFRLTRGQMLGADGSQTPCAAWSLNSKSMSFTCDDSTLPASAYPYVIDPTGTYNLTAGDATSCGGSAAAPWPTSFTCTADGQTSFEKWTDPSYYTIVGAFLRINTSSLPDAAIVSAATLRVGTAGGGLAEDGAANLSLVGQYYSDWPITTADAVGNPYSVTANAFIVGYSSLPQVGRVPLEIALSNVANVSLTGYTGFRVVLRFTSGGGFPTGLNRYAIYTLQTFTEVIPRLTITYTVPTPKLIIVSQ